MSVRIDTQGAVATVVIDRPDRRNAVDAQTAKEMELEAALTREYELGKATIDSGESFEGASRFAGGAGRHGAPAS